MNRRELRGLDVPGPVIGSVQAACKAAARTGLKKRGLRELLRRLVAAPDEYFDDEIFGAAARALVETRQACDRFETRRQPAPWQRWGSDIDDAAIRQLENASRLPVAVAGALMPDAHVGYGLPIGGVLATDNAVIPYAVGVDIACRMKLTVLDLPTKALEGQRDRLRKALLSETRFGIGSSFRPRERREHQVLDEDWSISEVTRRSRDKAWAQLGTSGSGNHFVEYGTLTFDRPQLGLESGSYLALLSHSGSRGAGAQVASWYCRLARRAHPELPKELMHLAWLDLSSEDGHEYWLAMQLMGRYAAANHSLIHHHVARALGADVLLDIENHHNFAWQEIHEGRSVIVHRKGATPAGRGVLGIIPGSMGTPGFLVRGLGNKKALESAAHGAGRRMSRKAAKQRFTWSETKRFLKARQVELISAGLDEAPMAYKDIHEVMAAQTSLVEPVARFDPRLVRMAPAGDRPED